MPSPRQGVLAGISESSLKQLKVRSHFEMGNPCTLFLITFDHVQSRYQTISVRSGHLRRYRQSNRPVFCSSRSLNLRSRSSWEICVKMVTNPPNIHVGDQECYVDFKEIQ